MPETPGAVPVNADIPAGTESLLTVSGIGKSFRIRGRGGRLQALDDVSMDILPGETVAVVGESGSGKSTLARVVLRLLPPDEGAVTFQGTSIWGASGRPLTATRLRMQPIFQDPGASFNPRRRIGAAMAQALAAGGVDEEAMPDRIRELLRAVGLSSGSEMLERRPHQFSGGQRQRLAIARALAVEPTMLIADEPLTGADVSVRGQILNLLRELQDSRGLALMFITHDIAVARAVSHRVVVMKDGRVVESGPTDRVLTEPVEEYTKRLLCAVPAVLLDPIT
ncbi:ABC transporter ATP-binding protein [Pseudonocardia sp. GCM10023141]|uniref:ABC transporter ATP-binding protein n=1 Tax=Pseudonocardia sp. GCM10023141 TaxID=3252653 RepID=UPI003619E3AD